jgi:G3E family GTPase
MERIPVTILTGFLGSGKTTLLNRILTESHGRRIAVIENEFGEIGIDQALVINAEEEVFEMNNGCICCTVRGDLIRILGALARRRDKFDRVVVETTGLADPGPVAQTFFVDDEVRGLFRLDGIVTLVDAKHVAPHLDESAECKEQIAFADVLVLNKTDLATADELDALERRVRGMNAMAEVLRATGARVPLAAVLDVGGFDLERALATRPTFLDPEYPFEWAGTYDLDEGAYELTLDEGPDETMGLVALSLAAAEVAAERGPAERAARAWSNPAVEVDPAGPVVVDAPAPQVLRLGGAGPKTFRVIAPRRGRVGLFTQHLPSEFRLRLARAGRAVGAVAEREFAAGHAHDETVGSVGIHLEGEVDGERLRAWLSRLLRERGTDIFRMKGILNLRGSPNRFVFQGVHMLFDGREGRAWGDERRASDLVFIGRGLDRRALTQGFRQCLA